MVPAKLMKHQAFNQDYPSFSLGNNLKKISNKLKIIMIKCKSLLKQFVSQPMEPSNTTHYHQPTNQILSFYLITLHQINNK